MSEKLSAGRVVRSRHTSQGNMALLVLVDSSGPYHHRCIVDETVLVALEHFGMPYRLLDLAEERPTVASLRGCAGLVIAQDGLGARLSAAEEQLIADGVAAGMGLVSFDGDLRGYRGPLPEVFGFRGVERLPYATNLLLVPSNSHYITRLQDCGAFHQSARMVSAVMVREWRPDAVVLAEAVLGKEQLVYSRHIVPGNAYEPRHYPAAFAARWGSGRAVQWLVNPRLWRAGALGHLGGLDDLFWRGIVWAVRKPFAANMIPPFVTMSFDDCSGRHDFRYLDACKRHGFTPLVSLFLDNIQEQHFETLRRRALAGEILLNTHSPDYYTLQYWDFGVMDYSEERIRQLFEREDDFYRRLGAGPCRVAVCHFGEMGLRALPFLKQRDRRFLRSPTQLSVLRADQSLESVTDGYWPFGSTERFYDYAPDDHSLYFCASFNARHLADFLTGATLWLRESPHNDLEMASRQGAAQICGGLADGFFGDLLTHEQKLQVLTLEEWDQIVAGVARRIERFETVPSNHDEISSYVKAKDESWIAQAETSRDRDDGRGARCLLRGRAEHSLRLSLFADADDGVERHYLETPAFAGETIAEAA